MLSERLETLDQQIEETPERHPDFAELTGRYEECKHILRLLKERNENLKDQ